MVNLAQRIQELRTEKGMSRLELSAALGLPKNAVEKFETGRQTPTQVQQETLASFFGVSIFYLRGESSDRTRQEDWMAGMSEDGEAKDAPRPAAPRARPAESRAKAGEGSLLEPFLKNKAFQDMVQATILEVLRSKEGQDLLERAVRHELDRQG